MLEAGMRHSLFDTAAKKRTISLTVNGDLYAKAKSQGINASQVAEDALAEALAARVSEKIRAEIQQDLTAYNAYIEKHGSPAEMLRDYLAQDDDAV
jgi:antitoxin CcdA